MSTLSQQLRLFSPVPKPVAATPSVAEQTASAIQRVEDNADRAWLDQALDVVRCCCEEMPEFFSDDIWDRGLEQTREDRALGPVLLRAKRLGWCEKTNYTKPSRRSNLSGKPVWRSLIYKGAR